MSNQIGGVKKAVGDSAPEDLAYCETNQEPGRFSDRSHKAEVGTPSGDFRVQQSRRQHHDANAEPGQTNDDGRAARKSNANHTDPNVGGYPQRPAVKK